VILDSSSCNNHCDSLSIPLLLLGQPALSSLSEEGDQLFAGHYSDVDVVGWHPNAHFLATGSSDHSVRLWDMRTGEASRILIGHKSPVSNCLPFGSQMFIKAHCGWIQSAAVWAVGLAVKFSVFIIYSGWLSGGPVKSLYSGLVPCSVARSVQ